jgi:hypothetical protein
MADNPIDRDALMTVAEFYFALLALRSRSASAINTLVSILSPFAIRSRMFSDTLCLPRSMPVM